VKYFPDAASFGPDAVLVEQDPADPEDVRYRIQGIEGQHRMCIAILTFLRAILTAGLCVCGMSYLIKTNGYADLLMNGVTLAFVAELAALFYAQVLREEIRDQCEDIKPMHVKMIGIDWLNRRPAVSDMISCVILFGVVYGVMYWQLGNVVHPVYGSLTCTCGQTGADCLEAQKFNYNFWNHYWGVAVPGVFDEVSKLKSATPGAAMMFANEIVKPSMSEMLEDQSLEMRMQKVRETHGNLEKEIDALEKKWENRRESQAPVAKEAAPAIPKRVPKPSSPLEDGEKKVTYTGSKHTFGSVSLLGQKKHISRMAL
jgi:hypothetical protein